MTDFDFVMKLMDVLSREAETEKADDRFDIGRDDVLYNFPTKNKKFHRVSIYNQDDEDRIYEVEVVERGVVNLDDKTLCEFSFKMTIAQRKKYVDALRALSNKVNEINYMSREDILLTISPALVDQALLGEIILDVEKPKRTRKKK